MACNDYIVDLTLPSDYTCRCGFPKDAHKKDDQSMTRRRSKTFDDTTLRKVEQEKGCSLACKDYIVDLESSTRSCKCGYPKSAHTAPVSGRSSSSTRRGLAPEFFFTAPARDSPNAATTPAESKACDIFQLDMKCEFMRCKCGFPKSVHMRGSAIYEASMVREMAQSVSIQKDPVSASSSLQTPRRRLSDHNGLANALDRFESLKQGYLAEQIPLPRKQSKSLGGLESERSRGFSDDGKPDIASDAETTPGAIGHDEEACEDTPFAGTSVASQESSDSRECRFAADPDSETLADENDDKPRSVSKVKGTTDLFEQGRHKDVADEPVAAVEADAAVEAAKATFRNVRPLWTQAAQEAEDKANTVKNAAEQRAAAEREKEVRAANKARAQEEYKAAKQGQKEQKALEEARQQAADDEARVKVAAEQERVLHRQTQRIRKAMEKEADALRQAEAREHAARMKAAQLAASRTEAMLCACGGELMVAPDEMQTLERYVPDFQNKTAEQLAEVLPTLRMGAWLQGGKRLFDGKSSGDAAPASIGVA